MGISKSTAEEFTSATTAVCGDSAGELPLKADDGPLSGQGTSSGMLLECKSAPAKASHSGGCAGLVSRGGVPEVGSWQDGDGVLPREGALSAVGLDSWAPGRFSRSGRGISSVLVRRLLEGARPDSSAKRSSASKRPWPACIQFPVSWYCFRVLCVMLQCGEPSILLALAQSSNHDVTRYTRRTALLDLCRKWAWGTRQAWLYGLEGGPGTGD